jgi:hypothetical protein
MWPLLTVIASLIEPMTSWRLMEAGRLGIKMLVPADARVRVTRQGAWRELRVGRGGISLYASQNVGAAQSAADMEGRSAELTGIAGRYFRQIARGSDRHGWRWYRNVLAEKGRTVVYGTYGAGSRGTYLFWVKCSREDFDRHEAELFAWSRSIEIF